MYLFLFRYASGHSYYFLLYDGYCPQNTFYIKILQDKGVNISFTDLTKLKNGDHLIICQKKVKNYISKNYSVEIIKNIRNVTKCKIISRTTKS
jgi:acetone carboxylase gamma subunit